jgi:flagellum-specific ATP synthase
MRDIVSKDHWNLSLSIKSLLAVFQQNHDLIQIGAYQSGANPLLDRAIAVMPLLESFLKQDTDELSSMKEALAGLLRIHQASLAQTGQKNK